MISAWMSENFMLQRSVAGAGGWPQGPGAGLGPNNLGLYNLCHNYRWKSDPINDLALWFPNISGP